MEDGDNAKQAVDVGDAGQESELLGGEGGPLRQLSESEYQNVTAKHAKMLQARLKHAGASVQKLEGIACNQATAVDASGVQNNRLRHAPGDCSCSPNYDAVVLLTNAAAAEEAPPQLRRRRNPQSD